MEQWLQEHLESEAGSMFQNDNLRLAKRQIRQIDWIPTNRYKIDLHSNQLTSLPALHAYIEHLNVQDNLLRYLPLLPPRLTYLRVDGNPLDQLPPLPASLRVLQASYCRLVDLPEFPRKLEYLILNYNHLTKLPTLPDRLESLEIHHNDIQELPFLPLSLYRLVLAENPALAKYSGKTIPEIRQMICMRLASERAQYMKQELISACKKYADKNLTSTAHLEGT